MALAYKRVLVSMPEEMLEEVDRAAKEEHRNRNEFVREALRDRIGRNALKASLGRVRASVENDYSEEEIERDIDLAVAEVRTAKRASGGR